MFAHGGLFRTSGVAERFLAAALASPVTVGEAAAEGGPWGMAVLAAYAASGAEADLSRYLREQVFAGAATRTTAPEPDDVAAFADYLRRYEAGLAVERAAIAAL
jgi:sugar (pentulose or hexulose) kinase